MKRLLLACTLLLGSVAAANAACTSPAVMHDFPGTTFNMSLATNAGDGNCSSNMTIVGTVPLPTGAATLAKQPALGSAGSASTDVISVQGIAAMTPLFMQSGTVPIVTMNSVNSNNGVNSAVSAVFDDVAPTAITENSFGFLRMSNNRNLYGTIRDAAGNERGANIDASNRLTTAPTIVSGAVASGAYASGSIASGALASGSVASGAMVDLGSQADAACGTDNGSCSAIALIKRGNQNLTTVNTTAAAAVAAGTNRIGYVSDDPCTQKAKTNLPISQNGTSSVQLIALSGATVIYVCSLSLIAAGATTVAFTTGTGSACVTGNAAVIGSTTANIANSLSLAANGGLTLGNGAGTIAQGAASSELCMVLGTNVFASGNLTYVQQ